MSCAPPNNVEEKGVHWEHSPPTLVSGLLVLFILLFKWPVVKLRELTRDIPLPLLFG